MCRHWKSKVALIVANFVVFKSEWRIQTQCCSFIHRPMAAYKEASISNSRRRQSAAAIGGVGGSYDSQLSFSSLSVTVILEFDVSFSQL